MALGSRPHPRSKSRLAESRRTFCAVTISGWLEREKSSDTAHTFLVFCQSDLRPGRVPVRPFPSRDRRFFPPSGIRDL